MKGSILGLSAVAAAVAFAGSSIYLYTQLQEERGRSREATELTRRLNARISELEKARNPFAERSAASGGAFGGVEMARGGPGVPPPDVPVVAASSQEVDEPAEMRFRPDRSPAMRKMMKAQMRANQKRMYGDFAEQIGLSKEDANKFYDLLTEQQMVHFGEGRRLNPEDARTYFQEQQRKQQAELTELLGAENAESLQKYQESLPARSEVEMIAQQLEASDIALSADQRKRLVAALTEERTRVPQPDYSMYGDSELYSKALSEWQNDYNDRTAARARSILNSEQDAAYNEYQQLQKEMREQFATLAPGPRRFRAGAVASGNVVMDPAGPPVIITDTIGVAVPPPPETAAKPQ
jgi:hypothetical protein